MCQAGPRWRRNCEIAWYIEQLLLHVRYTISKCSPLSNTIICPVIHYPLNPLTGPHNYSFIYSHILLFPHGSECKWKEALA